MEQFKTVEKWFGTQASLASSDPYQDVCDNYSDFIKLLKTYSENKKNRFTCFSGRDKMEEVFENIIGLLRVGLSTCPNWNDYDGVRHFCYVNSQIILYKQQQTEN